MEFWKDIQDYESIYQISSFGNVRSLDRYQNGKFYKGQIIKPIPRNGYLSVWLYKDGDRSIKNVHRLVAMQFIPNPNNYPVVNHIDGNKQNNNKANLEWTTVSYNTKHAYEKGLIKTTENMIKARRENVKIAAQSCEIKVKCVERNIVYDSVIQAAKDNGLKGSSSIIRACKNPNKKAAGFHWEYVN